MSVSLLAKTLRRQQRLLGTDARQASWPESEGQLEPVSTAVLQLATFDATGEVITETNATGVTTIFSEREVLSLTVSVQREPY